jgi:hypothetical protein
MEHLLGYSSKYFSHQVSAGLLKNRGRPISGLRKKRALMV